MIEEGTVKGLFQFVQEKLKPSEAKPVPLIKAVKKRIQKDTVNIIDASPGTSCPVVHRVKDTDFCILVTIYPEYVQIFKDICCSIKYMIK